MLMIGIAFLKILLMRESLVKHTDANYPSFL